MLLSCHPTTHRYVYIHYRKCRKYTPSTYYQVHNNNKNITTSVDCQQSASLIMVPAPLPAKSSLSPSAWQKELQRTVAVAVLDKVSGGPTMTIKNLQNKINLLYHGDPSVKGSIGYLESLLRGRGQFEDLWSREELNTNIPERNADRVSAFDLVLKE